jgi:uncharacterized DUF497 family protein
MRQKVLFEWDDIKEKENKKKHGASFTLAQHALLIFIVLY